LIYGIGIDIIKIERVKSAAERWGDRFLRKVLAYCFRTSDPYPSLSVRFAAKEAFIKALGSRAGVSFRDIEVVNSESGRPSVEVRGRLRDLFEKNSLICAHLSLSHEREYGVACVVIEK
jgi:holo-[acyl-carrier protein] synthase